MLSCLSEKMSSVTNWKYWHFCSILNTFLIFSEHRNCFLTWSVYTPCVTVADLTESQVCTCSLWRWFSKFLVTLHLSFCSRINMKTSIYKDENIVYVLLGKSYKVFNNFQVLWQWKLFIGRNSSCHPPSTHFFLKLIN